MDLLTLVFIILVLAVVFGGFGLSSRPLRETLCHTKPGSSERKGKKE